MSRLYRVLKDTKMIDPRSMITRPDILSAFIKVLFTIVDKFYLSSKCPQRSLTPQAHPFVSCMKGISKKIVFNVMRNDIGH